MHRTQNKKELHSLAEDAVVEDEAETEDDAIVALAQREVVVLVGCRVPGSLSVPLAQKQQVPCHQYITLKGNV